MNQFSRTEALIGIQAQEKLKKSKIAVFGLGGVGGHATEALARAGIGHIVLVDYDTYDITNINRQIGALHSTMGKYKVDVMKERILDINPSIIVETYKSTEDETKIIDSTFTYVIDAIDTMKNKIKLIEKCNNLNVPIISIAGTGNKLDATKFEVEDIYKTSVCPVCKILRKELKSKNINKLKVVYSKEMPKKSLIEDQVLGSISYVPSVAGLIAVGEVVKYIISI